MKLRGCSIYQANQKDGELNAARRDFDCAIDLAQEELDRDMDRAQGSGSGEDSAASLVR